MQNYISLVRAINVGGTGLVSMETLKALFLSVGCVNIRSLLQSGNLVFRFKEGASLDLEQRLERAAADQLKLKTTFIVRTSEEWLRLTAANPFPEEARTIPARLLVMCLKTEPDPTLATQLKEAIKGREYMQLIGRELYIVYPDGSGNSKFTGQIIERKLGISGTTRNWSTVLKIAAELNR